MVILLVAMAILQKQLLVHAVPSEEDGCRSETGEESLKAIPSREGAGVSPGLVSSPGIVLCPDRSRIGRGLELVDVEASGVSAGHGDEWFEIRAMNIRPRESDGGKLR